MVNLRKFLEQAGFRRIYLKKLKTGHYELELKVNGVPGRFIVDSGASSSCIGVHARAYFGLQSIESDVKAAGAGAVDMAASVSNEVQLGLDGRTYRNVSFVLFDLSHVNQALDTMDEAPVHGIMGAELLKKIRAVIDYGRNALYFK